MDFSSLKSKLIDGIDLAYKQASDERLTQVQSSISEIVQYYQTNNMSLWGLANFEAIIDFKQIQSSNKLPSLIKIGYLNPVNYSTFKNKIPSIIDLYSSKGILIDFDKGRQGYASSLLQNIILRIILSLPEDLLKISLIDGFSSGADLNCILSLDKYKKDLYTTESEIINILNSVVADFTHIQTTILTHQYSSVEEYNLHSKIKCPYRLIVVANYPEGFSLRRDVQLTLRKIIEHGSKYGTFVLITRNTDISKAVFAGSKDEVSGSIGRIIIGDKDVSQIDNCKEKTTIDQKYSLKIDSAIPSNIAGIITYLNERYKSLAKQIGSFDNYYSSIVKEDKVWKNTTEDFAEFLIGIDKKTKENGSFIFGKNGVYHALIGGRTGGGKSVLINNIIINASYKYSPEELQFYVIDLKGNEYPGYDKLPHIKVLFQDAQRIEIALNVLEEVQAQYYDRVKEFKKLKVNELKDYKKVKKLHRIVLIIDEFQTFNQSENYNIKIKSNEIIELLITKGRSYGIHVILASQHLANANLSTTALSNIQARLVLPLSADGCHYILSRQNIEPEQLENLELIYNDTLGYKIENNLKFKIPFLKGDLLKPHIDFLNHKFHNSGFTDFKRYFMPPSDDEVMIDDCPGYLTSFHSTDQNTTKIYLGIPYLIKEDDSFLQLEKEIENNILIVGHDLQTAYRLLYSIISQFLSKNSVFEVIYLQYTPKSGKYFNLFEKLSKVNTSFKHLGKEDTDIVLTQLEDKITARKNLDSIESDILFVIPQINVETAFNSRNNPTIARIKKILENGPLVGVHCLIFSETYNSISDISSLVNASKYRIATKGGGSENISNKKEVDEDGFFYYTAPSDYTKINPDLVRAYNSIKEDSLNNLSDENKNIIRTLYDVIS